MSKGLSETMYVTCLAQCSTHSNDSVKSSCREPGKSLFYGHVGSKELGRGLKTSVLESVYTLKDMVG